jgi:hypothetical protein
LGHMQKNCTNTVRLPHCVYCKKTDHEVETCQKRLSSTCKQCGTKGHSAAWHLERFCHKCNTEHSGLNGCRA